MSARFGIGIYTAHEAAGMIGTRAATLRRWLGDKDEALWQVQHERVEGEPLLLGFRDLIEARIVAGLRSSRLSLQAIRVCIRRAQELIGDEHPLSTKHFKTDGRSLFLQMTDGVNEPALIDLRRRQGVFHRVVEPTLSDIGYDEHAADRWWLLEGKKTVVADPALSFGSPVLADHGILTDRMAQAVEAEGSIPAAARIFDIRPALVRDAVAYERRRREALAA